MSEISHTSPPWQLRSGVEKLRFKKNYLFIFTFFFSVLKEFPNFPTSRAHVPKLAAPRHRGPALLPPVLCSKAREGAVLGLQGLKELNLSRYFCVVWRSCLLCGRCCRVSVTPKERRMSRQPHSQTVTGTASKSLCQGLAFAAAPREL